MESVCLPVLSCKASVAQREVLWLSRFTQFSVSVLPSDDIVNPVPFSNMVFGIYILTIVFFHLSTPRQSLNW